jgi:hypothetical protein
VPPPEQQAVFIENWGKIVSSILDVRFCLSQNQIPAMLIKKTVGLMDGCFADVCSGSSAAEPRTFLNNGLLHRDYRLNNFMNGRFYVIW